MGSNPRIQPFADGRHVFSIESARFKSCHRPLSHHIADHIDERSRDNTTARKSILASLAYYIADPRRRVALTVLTIPEPTRIRHPDTVCTVVARPQGVILAPCQPCVAGDHPGQTHHDISPASLSHGAHLCYRHRLLLILAIHLHCQ